MPDANTSTEYSEGERLLAAALVEYFTDDQMRRGGGFTFEQVEEGIRHVFPLVVEMRREMAKNASTGDGSEQQGQQ
ncbi:hypothetical protein N7493_005429 [Penicillium malachiteum]|uniref:Uncharacterized protein n=1 Tax=Penicillium malachiteum TaxID=1324776 RepID=A0AAD6HND4_9EURO|nr:hypothetical protein N7493_005429 [Penicillium malachiteum]